MFHLDSQTLGYAGQPVLQDVSLEIRAGEKVSLLGRSGAGKTTLLKSLYEQNSKQVALIPQDTALVQTLSVFHNVYMGRLHHHPTWYNLRNLVWPAAAQREAMLPLLSRLGLDAKTATPVGELSGGQRQRVAVARAVHQQRPVLFGDEPVSAVDERQAEDVLALIFENHDTVVLAMHDVELALAFSSRVIGLDEGRIVLDRAAGELSSEDLRFLYRDEESSTNKADQAPEPPSEPIALESY